MNSEDLTIAFKEHAINQKRHQDNFCADVISDEEVTQWLNTTSELLDWVYKGIPVDLGPDRSQPDNLRMKYKIDARNLLRHAPWLRESTRAKLQAFVDEPPLFIHRGKYKLTYDSFSARILQWKLNLAPFVGQPELHFLEVGSYEGNSACWMLDNVLTHQSSDLTCIDPYKESKDLFEYNIAQTSASDRVIRLPGYSYQVLPTLTPEYYHFIYLDASHEQVSTLEDAVLAWRLLRRNGLLTFDDYRLKDSYLSQLFRQERPDIAIDAFLQVYDGHFEMLYQGYHVTIRKL